MAHETEYLGNACNTSKTMHILEIDGGAACPFGIFQLVAGHLRSQISESKASCQQDPAAAASRASVF